MNAKFLNPSNYFSVTDFEDGATFKIIAVEFEDVEDEKNKTKKKGALRLEGATKPWLCNVTNVRCLVAMFGDETDAWLGRRVTLCHERVMAFGEWTLGVRLRGSPDIAKPVSVKLKLRKKKEQVITMQPTGPAPKSAAPATPYNAMWAAYKAAKLTDAEQFKSMVSESTGKAKDWTDADVPKFEKMLAALTSPNGIDAPSEPGAGG